MTIQTETSKVVYECDGNTKIFPVSFYFFDNQIAVYKNMSTEPLHEGSDYVVRNAENYYGGEVELSEMPAAGDIITIVRNVEFKQLITFLEGESFPAKDYEYALDKLTMALQQLRECLSRAITMPHNQKISSEELLHCIEILNTHWKEIIAFPELVDEKLASFFKKLQNVRLDIGIGEAKKNTEFSQYPYTYDLALSEVTENHVPYVIFADKDAANNTIAPFVKSYNGGITFYLKSAGVYFTTIPQILLL